MSQTEIENKLREWFEKTGYPLEMSAVEILNKHHYKPHPSNLYQDYETDKVREIDIIAYKSIELNEVNVEFKFIIECKKSNKPFILLTHDKDTSFITNVFLNIDLDNPIAHSCLETFVNFENYKKTLEFNWTKFDIGFKIIQGFTDSDDTVYTAINSIIKSYKYFTEFNRQAYDIYIEDNWYSLSIPVFLIDAPLYKAFFDKSNIIQIEKIESAFINVKKPWEFENDSNYYIPIVALGNFEKFIKELDSLMMLYLVSIGSMPVEFQIKNMFDKKGSGISDSKSDKDN